MPEIPSEYVPELTECFKLLSRRAFGYAYSSVGGDRCAAEDLVQQAFQAAAENWAELRTHADDERIKWLCLVIKHDAVDLARRRAVALRKQSEVWRRHGGGATDPFEAANLLILIGAFTAALAKLPARQRQVVELKWRDGMKNSEIAAALGISSKAVSSHVSAARDKLRRIADAHTGDEQSTEEGGTTP